jgi:cytoskeleton protein RodZ
MTMTDEVVVEPTTSAATEFATLGERLVAAREAKKLSLQDVSDSLRFSVKQISALERGDFDALPDAMITRGFIRNYARFVEIDAEPLLASYRVYVPDQLPGTLSMESLMHEVMPGKDSQPWLQYILGSIVVLLFLLAWFFYMDYMPKPVLAEAEKASVAADANDAAVEINLPEIALPAGERLGDSTDVATDTTATLNATSPIATVNEKLEASTTDIAAGSKLKANAENQSVQVAPTPAARVEATPAMKKVSMTFSDETWVRATDKSGKVVFERIMPAASQDDFDGVPPIDLVIGNASATKLTYLGKSVDLVAVSQGNVARLTLQ